MHWELLLSFTLLQRSVLAITLITVDVDGILKNTPDLDFSINFVKQLLDGTMSDYTTSEQHKIFISHNSKIGQLVSSIASYKDGYR